MPFLRDLKESSKDTIPGEAENCWSNAQSRKCAFRKYSVSSGSSDWSRTDPEKTSAICDMETSQSVSDLRHSQPAGEILFINF